MEAMQSILDVHFSGYVPTPLGKAPGKVLCAGSSDGEHKCMTCLCWPAAHHFAILWASVGNTVPATFWALYYLINQQEALQAVRNELHQVLKLPEAQGPQQPEVIVSKEQLDQLLLMGEFRLKIPWHENFTF